MNKFAIPMVFASILSGVLFGVLMASNAPVPKTQTGIEWLPSPRAVNDYDVLLPYSTTKWRMVLFGYLHCPDVCPTNLSELASLNKVLEQEDEERLIEVTLVSVDPKRDEKLDIYSYVEHFGRGFSGVILTQDKLQTLNTNLGVSYRQPDTSDEYYLVSHSPIISLIDRHGQLVGRLRSGFDAALVAKQLRQVR